MKHFLKNCTEEDFKRIDKKLKEALKDVNNGRQREFFLSEYIANDHLVEFMNLLYSNFHIKFEEEKTRAWNFLINPDNAEAYGLNDRKVNEAKALEWANLAYPNITEQLWEVELEMQIFNSVKANN